MTTSPAKSVFTIRLTGKSVQPDLLAAGDLAQLLIAAEQTVLSVAKEENPDQIEEIRVTLSGIKSESVGLQFISNEPELVGKAFHSIVDRIQKQKFSDLPGPTLEGLKTFVRFTSERAGHTQFWNGNTSEPLLDLGPEFATLIPTPEYQHGETTVYGLLERIGGVKPRIKLRIAPSTIIYGDVTEEQARQLGPSLYKTVALKGKASWDLHTDKIVYFRVLEILHYQPGNIRDIFAAIHSATGGAYDKVQNVDVLAFQIREGELPE